jgi:hypothetical protein
MSGRQWREVVLVGHRRLMALAFWESTGQRAIRCRSRSICYDASGIFRISPSAGSGEAGAWGGAYVSVCAQGEDK